MSSSTPPPENVSRRDFVRQAALAASAFALAATPADAQTGRRRGLRPGTPPAGAPGAAPGTPATAGNEWADKNIDDVVKGFDKLPGVLTLYRKKNDLYAEIRPDQLGQTLLLQITRATGTAGFGGTVGDPLDDTLFVLQKENDHISLAVPNLRFRAQSGTPEEISVRRSFAGAYLASFKIEAVRPDPAQAKAIADIKDKDLKAAALDKAATGYLIHIPSLFLTDIPGFTQGLPGFSVDADKTYLKSVQNFPDNLVVTSHYHFAGKTSVPGVDTLTDDRSIPEQIVYNLFALKDTGYKPRFYDDRIGYFTEDYQTFDEDTSDDNARRMIQRWHLVKKDPQAALSEPVKPIKFWVDNATPVRYRAAIQEGVLSWNTAFAKIGYKNAVACEIMPVDTDWDPADMRHNVIRWMSSPGAGYAVAQFRHNPLTGEIVNASISVDASWARFTNLGYPTTVLNGQSADGMTPQQYADGLVNAKPADVPHGRSACQLGMEMQMTSAFGWDSLEVLPLGDAGLTPGEKKPSMEEFTHLQLVQVVMHEFGHCLGLRHNFKGSTMLSPAQLQDKAMTGEFGIMGSVMDYGGPNLAPLGGKQADYFMAKPGPYDQWAIEYGYQDFGDSVYKETLGLKAIASRSREFGHDYASDENADTIDPTITRYDLSSDPLAYRVALVEKAHRMLGLLEFRQPLPGEPYYTLTRKFTRILGQYNSNSVAVARFIGGIVTERNHYGDAGAVAPVQPVPFADQRRALQVLCRIVFSDTALRFSPDLLARLQQNPVPYGPLTAGAGSQDLSILDTIANVQAAGLYAVLNPGTLGRIETNEFRAASGSHPLSVLEAIDTVTGTVWADLGTPVAGPVGAVHPLRRRLQRTHVDALIALARPTEAGGTTTGDAGAFSQATLRGLAAKISAAEKRPHDPVTAAHLTETRVRIARFLHAQAIA